MELKTVIRKAIEPAYKLLPPAMASKEATVLLLAIGLQESRFEHRYQIVQGRPGAKGPARGFWQFEKGTQASRGGVWGVYLHPASKSHLEALCKSQGVPFNPDRIWERLEFNDVLAAGVARLMLWTDPKALPAVGQSQDAWLTYLRVWRPGKPHPQTWPVLYNQAVRAV